MGVTVRSVHLMERAHSVENFVLNSPNNLLMRPRGETTVTQSDVLDTSFSANLAVAFASSFSVAIEGGEPE